MSSSPNLAGWRVLATPSGDEPEAQAAALRSRHAQGEAELTLTQRCARELAAVLRGGTDPLALLFPGGSLADTERLYRDSPPAKTYNALIADVFERIVAQTPAQRPLRVLEIGAGTGSTTAYVLDGSPVARVEYTFTDVSPLFLHRAREKFTAQASSMRYQLLDIGRDPAGQGFDAGRFDVVLGANVLHATADLDTSLGARARPARAGRAVGDCSKARCRSASAISPSACSTAGGRSPIRSAGATR